MTSLFSTQPKRMARELQQLDALAAEEPWFVPTGWGTTTEGDLCLNFQLKVIEVIFDGVLTYPEQFPDTPAFVRPKIKELWSPTHQYGGTGVLCLEYGPDNWHREVSGVDLVRSANELLWRELAHAVLPSAPAVPSRHKLSLGQVLRSHTRRLLLTPKLRELLEGMPATSKLPITTGTQFCNSNTATVVTRAGDAPETIIADVPQVLETEGFARKGWAVSAPALTELGPINNLSDLQSALTPLGCWPWPNELDNTYRPLLLNLPGNSTRAFLTLGGAEPALHEYYVVEFENDATPRLPASYASLVQQKVAVVGLGSLGSKIAISLARAGVREFVLVDDDVLAPHNLVRHQLDWRDVVFHKADALERALQCIAPGVVALGLTQRIAGQENSQVAATVMQKISGCSLIIDATANPRAFVALAGLCRRSSRVLVWGELFAGGTGALMARSRPGLDADPLSIRNHVQGVLRTFPPIPEGRAADYGLEAQEQVLIASDADVSALAASITQFALDALCSSDSVYPVAAYLLGYKKYWVFQQPYDTIPIDCTSATQPDECEEPLTAAEQETLESIAAAVEASNYVTTDSHA